MTELSADYKALASYRPKHKVRFVTAASLFDGHDAAINIMRRILQDQGAEVVRLGHDRSVDEIVVFDRGPYVSFANCGLPYFVGNVIREEKSLLVASRELFRDRFDIDVQTEHEVTDIDRASREIGVRDLRSGVARRERYDALVPRESIAAVGSTKTYLLRVWERQRRRMVGR